MRVTTGKYQMPLETREHLLTASSSSNRAEVHQERACANKAHSTCEAGLVWSAMKAVWGPRSVVG